MPLLIDGPSSPRNNTNVYLRPLIEELRSLFIDCVEAYDADKGETFIMRTALMWIINHFPAYGMLSGYSVHGYKACPYCHMDTTSTWLPFSKKICYCGHRRMLKEDHLYRDDDVHFDGTTEHREAPVPLSGANILAQWNDYENVIFGKVKERQEKPQGWNKKSIFFELPYWVTNTVRHNLDVMHIEKGASEHILNLLLCKDGKSKDNLQAQRDLQHLNIRKELHPIPKLGKPGKFVLPNAVYHMSKLEKKIFLEVLHELKVPTGFSGSFNKKIKTVKGKIDGLKSHDHHVIMEHLLPLSLRASLPESVGLVINELCNFFRELCAKTIEDKELGKLQEAVPLILCKLERIFPPSFFDIIIHLTVHLATEARLAGPVQYRWMYPIERYLLTLKNYIQNRNRPEGSIMEGYLLEENWNDELFSQVQDPNSELTLDDDLRCLARHPSLEVAYYKGFGINGYKFAIKEIEESRTIQNSRIAAIGAEGLIYYGYLDRILGIRYPGRAKLEYIFKCVWYHTRTGHGKWRDTYGTWKDEYRLTSVNTNLFEFEDEPYIFPEQAFQVYYSKCLKHSGWSVVCRWKPRDTYDVPQFADVDIEDNIEIDSDDEGLRLLQPTISIDENVSRVECEHEVSWVRNDFNDEIIVDIPTTSKEPVKRKSDNREMDHITPESSYRVDFASSRAAPQPEEHDLPTSTHSIPSVHSMVGEDASASVSAARPLHLRNYRPNRAAKRAEKRATKAEDIYII
ncbi:uncharacterized protein LOC109828187 [Asparagus officinalis]|uniref:uncharacterized protein LOC109828187 n=1 Tax=Asparagus officinalis TaxID=4686 RepID=UPI00098E61AF|nr:uncharacterized protein LOC109828187 [Asparagus officinalis]